MKTKLLFLLALAISLGSLSQTVWHPQSTGTNSYLFDVYFTSPTNGWLCGNTGLIMNTVDGGATWIEQDVPPVNTYYGIYFADNQNGWSCGYGGQISHTSDGGNTWSEQTGASNTFLYDIFFLNTDTGWIVGGDHGSYPSFIEHREILYTNDGGNSWIAQVSESYKRPLRSLHFADFSSGYAVGEAGTILHTSDGGNNWVEVMSDPFYEFTGIFTVNPTTAYITGIYLGLPHVPVIFKTTDAGITWSSQTFNEDESLADISFADENNGWAVGGTNEAGTILRTTDGGITWFKEDHGAGFLSSVFFINESTGWAVGTNGEVIAFQQQLPTGVEDRKAGLFMKIYPNPATEWIYIEPESDIGDINRILMISSTGQVVYDRIAGNRSSVNTYKINISGITQGLYNVVIEGSEGRVSENIIIK